MLAVGVEFLTGRYVATAYNRRTEHEWPPHPARFFSALAATHFAQEAPDARERAVLEWLESLAPPQIAASVAAKRDTVTVFVPVNDAAITSDVSKQFVARSAQQELLAAAEAAGDEKAAKKARTALEKAEKSYRSAVAKSIEAPSGSTKSGAHKALNVLPEHRKRMPRTFPSVTPAEPRVVFVWEDATPDPTQFAALDGLLRRVVCLGHSSSLVAARIVDAPEAVRFRPDPLGDRVLRAVESGQLRALEIAHAHHRETDPRVMPARFVRYTDRPRKDAKTPEPSSAFSDRWLVLRRVGGPHVPMVATASVARSLRRALLAHADEPIPPMLSGHAEDGTPLEDDHAAIVPLSVVGHAQASGNILGVALVLPRSCGEEERRAVYRAVSNWEDAQRQEDEETPSLPLKLGEAGVMELERVEWASVPKALRPETWCRPARRWRSATPVALDRNPGNLRSRDADEASRARAAAITTMINACARIGLPEPCHVTLLPHAPWAGSTKARFFPPFPGGGAKLQRVLVHVDLQFDTEVRGPILLGAGRYLGMGFLRPAFSDE